MKSRLSPPALCGCSSPPAKRRLLAAGLALLLTALPASAEVIGVEQFDYPDGPILNKNGGTFWDFCNLTAPVHDGTPSLWQNIFNAPTVASGRLVTSNSHALRPYNGPSLGGGSDEEKGIVTDGRLQQVVYQRVTLTTGAGVPSYLGLSAYDFATERIFFGKESTKTVFSIQTLNGFGSQNTGVVVDANTTYTLVSKVDYPNNRVSLFINPPPRRSGASPECRHQQLHHGQLLHRRPPRQRLRRCGRRVG